MHRGLRAFFLSKSFVFSYFSGAVETKNILGHCQSRQNEIRGERIVVWGGEGAQIGHYGLFREYAIRNLFFFVRGLVSKCMHFFKYFFVNRDASHAREAMTRLLSLCVRHNRRGAP